MDQYIQAEAYITKVDPKTFQETPVSEQLFYYCNNTFDDYDLDVRTAIKNNPFFKS